MIINLKQTPSKDDDGIFKENNIKKVNVQEFNADYTLEGISGMVRKEDIDIRKGESATSGSRSENSDFDKDQQLLLNASQKITLDIQTIAIDQDNLDELTNKAPELSNRTKAQEQKK